MGQLKDTEKEKIRIVKDCLNVYYSIVKVNFQVP